MIKIQKSAGILTVIQVNYLFETLSVFSTTLTHLTGIHNNTHSRQQVVRSAIC